MEINCIRILFCIDNFCVYVFIYIYCIVGMLYSYIFCWSLGIYIEIYLYFFLIWMLDFILNREIVSNLCVLVL